jgi:hypothetical protein
MMRPKILLTNSIDPAGVRVLEQSADVIVAPDRMRIRSAPWRPTK